MNSTLPYQSPAKPALSSRELHEHGQPTQSTAVPKSPLYAVAVSPSTSHSSLNARNATTSDSYNERESMRSPTKQKQRRNKPTLSCKECVERKTKCDRQRPVCSACVKRSSECEYTTLASVGASSGEKPAKIRKLDGTPPTDVKAPNTNGSSKLSISNITHPSSGSKSPTVQTSRYPPMTKVNLSSIAIDNAAPISIFGVGSEHPFGNYWTNQGGIQEVITVIPKKEQADILIKNYFEIVDPMYPILDRADFIDAYEHFWSLSWEGKCQTDPALLALHFVLYAIATQTIERVYPTERTNTAEFYISAAHQALRLSNFFSHINIPTVQSMLMTFHFLINDNHVSDAWVFNGITIRQAQVLQLHLAPNQAVPEASMLEKHYRLLIWQVINTFDAGLALFLKLPPASLIQNVNLNCFDEIDHKDSCDYSRLPFNPKDSLIPLPTPQWLQQDLHFSRSAWEVSNFVHRHITYPRALKEPICKSQAQKRDLVNAYRSVYDSFLPPFNSKDANRYFCDDPRLARQYIMLSSNYFHPLMLMHMDRDAKHNVLMDMYGTIEAAHEALQAFFAMHDRFGNDLNGYWALQHRSWEVALTVASLLAQASATAARHRNTASSASRQGREGLSPSTNSSSQVDYDSSTMVDESESNSVASSSWLLHTGKDDVRRAIDIIRQSSGYFEFQTVQTSRLDALRALFEKITIV